MNKAQLIDAIAAEQNLAKTQTAQIVDAVFENITKSLAKGEELAVSGFGTFKVSQRKARTGRNPKTGEEIKIAASKAPAFKAGKALKEAVNK